MILFIKSNEKFIAFEVQPESLIDIWKVEKPHEKGECICGKVFLDKKPYYSFELHKDLNVSKEECKLAGFKSIAVLPLTYYGEIVGAILFGSFKERKIEDDKDILESVTSQISIAFKNFLLHTQLFDYSKDLEQKVQKRTEELYLALEKAQYADRMKSAFLTAMSHELRTPLNSIIGFTGVLLQELPGSLNEEQKKQLSMVKKSSEHLLELINDVLDLSKIEAGELKLSYEEFSLFSLVDDIVNSNAPLIQKKGLQFDFSIDKKINTIYCDKRRLKQIIFNLLSNSIKFTHEGKISLKCEKEDKFIKFTIEDTGIGIKMEDQNLLFKPFSQINQGLNRNYEGTGLGLSICKNLINMMGGEISVESEFGKGSKFSFTIPIESNKD